MPYKKQQMRKRPTYRKRVYQNRTKKLVTGQGPTLLEKIASYAGPVATLAKAIVPVVAAINTEAKYIDSSAGLSPTLASPSIVCLSQLAQGLTDKTRIGNSLLAKSIQWRIRIIQNLDQGGTYGPPFGSIRMLLFIDKLQGGTAPTLAQIMESTANNLSMANKNYTDRFTILKDKVYSTTLNYAIPATTPAQSVIDFKGFKRLDFHMRYLGTGASASDNGPNALYLMCWPQHSLGTSFTFYTRLNFTDN